MGQPDIRVLSIGCSCINRFQFDFFIERNPESAEVFPRGLFDWNISSLVSTLNVLRLVAEGQLSSVLHDAELYSVGWDALILNEKLPGFTFFHEDTPAALLSDPARRGDFIGKLDHLGQPFVTPARDVHTHLIWSNLQPNLPDTVENVIQWDDFRLTEDRYTEVCKLGRQVFGPATTVSFLSTPQDMQLSAQGLPGVHVFDVPRSDAYQGDPLLYDVILRKVILGLD